MKGRFVKSGREPGDPEEEEEEEEEECVGEASGAADADVEASGDEYEYEVTLLLLICKLIKCYDLWEQEDSWEGFLVPPSSAHFSQLPIIRSRPILG
jgi:hypothetical protein